MTDIGVVSGLIELTDNFTSEIGLAQAALGNFTKENQASLKAVAGAAALVTGAIVGLGTAVLALGNRGADVNDLSETLLHFSGSADAANANMAALRAGTKGTVDNFILMKDASHLLSAGVKLNAEDFGTLGAAAFVLQNRGLGGTKEQLELVSDAMVTGRTRALAMAVGVVDAGDAEENYAKKLGVTKDQLSDSGKVEARRIEFMRILKAAVKDAGEQERDFGEQLEALHAGFTNYLDDVASSIAQSPVLAAGMKAIGAAFGAAFGGDNQELVKETTHWIEQGAIVAVNFGLGAIELARVVNVAWSMIKTVILGTETAVVGLVDSVIEAGFQVTRVMEGLHLVPEGSTRAIEDVRTQLRAMTVDLAVQTAEASKGVIGHSAFDKTLDELGGTLFVVKDAMVAASKAADGHNTAADAAAKSTKNLAASQDDANRSMIDWTKISDVMKKSLKELTGIQSDYAKEVAKTVGTSGDQQRAEIKATFDAQVGALDKLDPLFQQKYDLYAKIAHESLSQIGSDWSSLRDQSIEGMQETADYAWDDYERMLTGSLHFTRDALDVQLAKWRELQDEANGYGAAAVAAQNSAKDAAQRHTDELEKQKQRLIELHNAQQLTGGSQNVTALNLEQTLDQFVTRTDFATWGLTLQHAFSGRYGDAKLLAKLGYSFQEITSILNQFTSWDLANPEVVKNIPGAAGPRIPGFAEGGLVDIKVGERGAETIRIPLGTQVYPSGKYPGDVGNTYVVNLSGLLLDSSLAGKQALQRALVDTLTDVARSQRQF